MEYEYEQFITTVQREAGISWPKACETVRVVLSTLAERLSQGQARDIAAWLPGDLGPWLTTASDAQPFGVDEFLRRIAARGGGRLDTAERQARAVFRALGRSVPRDELEDMAAELPKDFAPLLAATGLKADRGPSEVVPAEEFLTAVANRAGLDEGAARAAVESVLWTLGERLARGEVEDLARELPPEFRHHLEHGDEETGGKAIGMSLQEFVNRVAEREGVRPRVAREHARAVFATLCETLSREEFEDMAAQLPDEYAQLLPSIAAPRN